MSKENENTIEGQKKRDEEVKKGNWPQERRARDAIKESNILVTNAQGGYALVAGKNYSVIKTNDEDANKLLERLGKTGYLIVVAEANEDCDHPEISGSENRSLLAALSKMNSISEPNAKYAMEVLAGRNRREGIHFSPKLNDQNAMLNTFDPRHEVMRDKEKKHLEKGQKIIKTNIIEHRTKQIEQLLKGEPITGLGEKMKNISENPDNLDWLHCNIEKFTQRTKTGNLVLPFEDTENIEKLYQEMLLGENSIIVKKNIVERAPFYNQGKERSTDMEHYKKINEHIYGTGFFSNIYCRGIFRGCKTQFLVHLVGNSGIGKSTYFINDHFAKGTYAQEKNAETLYETDQRFAETAMYHLAWELAEFDKFIEKHFEKIKTLLLASELWQRIVYAKKATKTLVSGMPFGTSNEPYIPHDQTTDKRFEVLMALASGTSLTKSIATDDVAPTYIQYCRKDIYDIGRQVSPFIQAIRNITDERNCSASEIHEIGNTFVDLTPTLKDSKGAHKKIFIKKTGEVLVDTIETFFEDAFKKIKEDKNTPYLYCQRSHLYSRIRSFHEQETREKREISDKEIKDALEGIEGIHFGKQRVVTETKKPIRFWYAGHLPDKQISNQFDMEMMPKIFPSEKDGTALK